MSNWQTPLCRKCGSRHLNFDPCPVQVKMGEGVTRLQAPEGFHTGLGNPLGYHPISTFGRNPTVPIVYRMPALRTHGSLTGADGEPYKP